MKITIPYGNFGKEKKTFDVIEEYRHHFLFQEDEIFKIANPQGLILLRNALNTHLSAISPSTFKEWVDWVCSLPDDMPNRLPGNNDFKGHSPTGNLYECRTKSQKGYDDFPF